MTVDDIPHNPPLQVNQPRPTSRLTWHYINSSSIDTILSSFVLNNSDLRPPADISEWPSSPLCNLFYASAVMKAWGAQSFMKSICTITQDVYYADSNPDVDNEPLARSATPRGLTAPLRQERYKACSERKAQDSGGRDLNSIMYGVAGLWLLGRRQQQSKNSEHRQQSKELADSHNKVKNWLQSTGASEGQDFNSQAPITESE